MLSDIVFPAASSSATAICAVIYGEPLPRFKWLPRWLMRWDWFCTPNMIAYVDLQTPAKGGGYTIEWASDRESA